MSKNGTIVDKVAKLSLEDTNTKMKAGKALANGNCNGTEVEEEEESRIPSPPNSQIQNATSSPPKTSQNLGARPKRPKSPVPSSSPAASTASSAASAVTSSSSLDISSSSISDESCSGGGDVDYVVYESELQMPDIMRLIQKDLSEPYSIYTYRYFIHNWPHLCFMARVNNECVGAIVCKLDFHKKVVSRGYIAMLAVDSGFRKRRIGSTLVRKAIQAMIAQDADEVVLETEITNRPALRLYENLGFVRDKRLFRYYLNGVDALRLKLWLR